MDTALCVVCRGLLHQCTSGIESELQLESEAERHRQQPKHLEALQKYGLTPAKEAELKMGGIGRSTH